MRLFLAFIFTFFLIGCSKIDDPKELNGTPVFYLNGYVNNNEIDIIAGENEYVLESEYSVNSNDIFEFTSSLSSPGKSNFKLSFTDQEKSISGESYVPNTFRPRFADFSSTKSTKRYEVIFNAEEEYNGKSTSYYWNFGDGNTAIGKQVTHVFEKNQAFYDVCLTVENNGESNTICMPVHLQTKFTSNFNHIFTNSETINYLADVVENPFYLYNWVFGIGASTTTKNATIKYNTMDKSDEVCLTVTLDGIKSTFCKNIVLKPEEFACIANYSYSIKEIPANASLNLSEVQVEFTDEHGVNYFSYTNNSQTSPLEILSVEDFTDPISKLKVKRVEVNFDCKLYNQADSIELRNIYGFIGFSYPVN